MTILIFWIVNNLDCSRPSARPNAPPIPIVLKFANALVLPSASGAISTASTVIFRFGFVTVKSVKANPSLSDTLAEELSVLTIFPNAEPIAIVS